MSGRLRDHLLQRLRHDARLGAIETAISHGILARLNEEPGEHGAGNKGRFARPMVDDDGFGFHVAAPDDQQSGRRLIAGSLVAGRPRHEVARIVARYGIVLSADPDLHPGSGQNAPVPQVRGRGGKENHERAAGKGRSSVKSGTGRINGTPSVGELHEAVRNSTPPPQADELAVMLLLVDAIEQAGFEDEEWRRVFRRPDWLVTVCSPVEGFPRRLTHMLRDGSFGRSFAAFDGYDIRSNRADFLARTQGLPSLVLFRGLDEEGKAGGEEKVALAARLGVPVLGLCDDKSHLPVRLRQAAWLTLETGVLSSAIICQVLQEITGVTPVDGATVLSDHICASLSLYDLAVAIRPGLGLEQIVATLRRLAGADENDGSMSRRRHAASSGSKRAIGADRNKDDKGRHGRKISSGSEIIQPVAPAQVGAPTSPSGVKPDAAAGALSGAPVVPTVETLHGYGEAKTWALDLKQDLELWHEGSLAWSQMSTRLLLSGPPGTGKTSFARALCNSLQVPLVATSVSTWLEPSYLGDVIKRIRVSFEEAATHAPCILFIDEVDGIGKRGSGHEHDDYWNSLVNKVLELLDGTSKSEGVIVIGATNHPSVIDPAIRRSGRLETHIEIPLPDIDALVGILAHHLGDDCAGVIESRTEQPFKTDVKADEKRACAPLATADENDFRTREEENADI